jgi:hypothetical protein
MMPAMTDRSVIDIIKTTYIQAIATICMAASDPSKPIPYVKTETQA